MGKYVGRSTGHKLVRHPVLGTDMAVPKDFKFFGNGAEKEKWERAARLAADFFKEISVDPGPKMVVDAFAGAGVLSLVYSAIGYRVIGMENNPSLFSALVCNFLAGQKTGNNFFRADNMEILPKFSDNDPRISIIDLDSYSSCVSQIREAARILKNGLLFVTAGDIYAGARFKNWAFAKKRYGIGFSGPENDYPEKVVFEFARREFARRGKSAKLLDSFAFKTMCRICVRVR